MTIVKQLESKSQFKKKIIFLLIPIVVSITILEIWAVNRLSTYGEQISQLEKIKYALQLQNQILENEIAQKSSLKFANNEAYILGFEHVKNIQYLHSEGLALSR